MNGRRRPHADDVDVRVAGGMVHGVTERGVIVWRGLPYAASPVGPLRFAVPAEVVPWEGLRNASEFGAIAPRSVSNPLLRPPSQAIASSRDVPT